VLLTFRSVNRTSARSNAGKMGAAILYLNDRAITTGGYYRLVIDLSGNKYSAERSDERFYLVREKEEAPGRGRAPDEAEKERKLKEQDERDQQYLSTLAKQLQPPPKPRRARFQAFKDSTLPKVDLRGCRVRDVYTPRQREPYSEGIAYLYFFPDGHTERAIIHLVDTDGDVYTLVVHPLTGRVEVLPGDIPVPRGFGEYDDEGNVETPR
jgi:general secretion pathway protein H